MAVDTLFAHEYRSRLLQRAPLLRRWLHQVRANGAGVGLLWFLLVLFGFRTSRQAVQRAITETTRLAEAPLRRVGSSFSRRLAALSSKGSRSDLQEAQRQEPLEQNVGDVVSNDWLQFTLGHMDTILVGFLGYKLCLLVLYTMPISYGFGIKLLFLKWASRAHLFRLYLRMAPFIGLGIVGAASAAVHYSAAGHTLARATINRWRALALLNGILTYCTSRLFELIRGDPKPYIALEESAQERDLLAFEAPAKGTALLKMMEVLLKPQRAISPPVLFGTEELGGQTRRLLFVGNHAILGVDVPLLIYCLYDRLDIWPRPLGEHAWFSVPVLGEVMYSIGAVDGTRRNCDLLMEKGCCLLVYPGGAREAWKRTTDKPYEILWGDHHLGFVRMAVRHGYTIVPIVTVGTEDIIRPVMDVPIRDVLTAGGMLNPPESSSKAFEEGARFPVVLPRPQEAQKVYFRIMPVLATAHLQGQEEDRDLLQQLRDETKRRLQEGISGLLQYRKSDPQRYVFRSKGVPREPRQPSKL